MFSARVETCLIGDRVERCRARDHLILPLRAINVHFRQARVDATSGLAGTSAVQDGCTWVGVQGGVHQVGTEGVLLLLVLAQTWRFSVSQFLSFPLFSWPCRNPRA